jgi:hypothetical protein
MGELESIKTLPGMIDAAADTLHKAWRAGIDLAAHAADDHPRLAAIARLEAAVLDQLPSGMMRPLDIVAAATARIAHAPAVLGPMEIVGLTELSPCWRPLLQALTAHIPVQWTAGPRSVPAWLDGTGVTIARTGASAGDQRRQRGDGLSRGHRGDALGARPARLGRLPSEIAIATASPADYDDHFLALRADANIDLHFVHGVRTVTTREGQAAAALADIVVRGLSQSRLRRLAALCRDSGPFDACPKAGCGSCRPMRRSRRRRLEPPAGRLAPEDWPDGADHPGAARGGRDAGERTGRPPARSEKPSSRAARSRSGARRCSPAPPPRSTRRWRP